MPQTLRVLQVEDSESDALLIARLLEKAGYCVVSERVEDAVQLTAALARRAWDVIICDYHLPQFDARQALAILQKTGIDIPFIVVSGAMGEDVAVEMMKAGAHDYVMKNNMARLGPAVGRELREAVVRMENRRAAKELREALDEAERGHGLLNAVFAAQTDAVVVWSATGAVLRTNPAATAFFGLDTHGLSNELGDWLGSDLATRALGGDIVLNVVRRAGKRIIETSGAPMRNANGTVIGAVTISRDITERLRAEERLRQTQKLESIGLLAGGIAHDFNNILTAVSGNITLAIEEACPDCEASSVLSVALESVQRAAGLTRQLLAYAGKGAFVRKSVSVASTIGSTVRTLRQSISSRIGLHTDIAADLPQVVMDPSQLEQVLLNLILNAAESIEDGRTGLVTVHACEKDGLVQIEVTDSGCGIEAETQKRIFEPFFTTKFMGRGLGLAAVDGIVRALSGSISVESTVGLGTSVRVLLPAAWVPAALPEPRTADSPAGTSGAVLIVDDELQIRKMAGALLKKRGIPVYEAGNGREAIDCLAANRDAIRVVLLDLSMPELTGDGALPAIFALQPDLHVVVSSGYSETVVRQHFRGMRVGAFLPKPYTGNQLLSAICAPIESQ